MTTPMTKKTACLPTRSGALAEVSDLLHHRVEGQSLKAFQVGERQFEVMFLGELDDGRYGVGGNLRRGMQRLVEEIAKPVAYRQHKPA